MGSVPGSQDCNTTSVAIRWAQSLDDWLQDFQRRRNDNVNKICVLEGVGEGDNLPKTLFFPGEFHDNKSWKFCEFIVRNFVVI